jgi:4-hydroxythreonine-4-phosphate dehydrogenase
MGDPSGIGPEICLKAIADQRVLDTCNPIIFGDTDILRKVADKCNLSMPAEELITDIKACDVNTIEPGKVQKNCGMAAYRYIESAVNATSSGNISAIATAPINKHALKLAGIQDPGHTEILARLTNSDHVCMMMASDEIIVTLATIHISIADVPSLLTTDNIARAIDLTSQTLSTLKKDEQRITVCGLNPHAGEQGMFGMEEESIIIPAIEKTRSDKITIKGPLPPDTAFTPEMRAQTDAYIVMYHDQGLIPFKMLSFETGVNITLGLPIVRTSVDHGTAFDIAWQSKASPESMIQSILWARRLADGRP